MTNTKTIYLNGGFGNVCFQLNYAHNLQTVNRSVILNTYLLERNVLTKQLLRWTIHDSLHTITQLQLLQGFRVESRFPFRMLSGAISKVRGCPTLNTEFVGLLSPETQARISDHLFGYFQIANPVNTLFVHRVRHALAANFSESRKAHLDGALNEIGEMPVVHIRGGDYQSDPSLALSAGYYARALRGESQCTVVTNDMTHALRILSLVPIHARVVSTTSTLEDFYLLSMSKRKVLANSTFSWWAAELGPKNSHVSQPEPYFDHVEWNPHTLIQRQKIATRV